MAQLQEPEVQFAQRLASNERPIRSKAIKKLRKYIHVRSQKDSGGFSGDDLLKLWKGLFYCLWMQDKPLLQEELSRTISCLIHSFHTVDNQFLYLETFLQTLNREWNGIDRLRMDKFFQLVRFVFRQMFEFLKRKKWESSVVSRFLELLTAQVLQSDGAVPNELQLHILALYMNELAAVGADELTADQNFIFIGPFCATAAKTKNRMLLSTICSDIFTTIIDQAPFAIEDLMKELKAAEELDSDSATEKEDENSQKEKTKSKQANEKMNGKKSNKECNDDLKDSDAEFPDDDMGPFLQFDYGALADKLFELASRSDTPSHNRQELYKFVKVLRNLSQGIFPRNEYPDDVSTDEDDDMFGSRKRLKRLKKRKGLSEKEEGVPAAKKKKEQMKESSKDAVQRKASADGDSVAAKPSTDKLKKKKKRKTKKRRGPHGKKGGVEKAAESKQEEIVPSDVITDSEIVVETSAGQKCSEVVENGAQSSTLADVKVLKRKRRKRGKKSEAKQVELQVDGAGTEVKVTPATCEKSSEITFSKKPSTVSGKIKPQKTKNNACKVPEGDAGVEQGNTETKIISINNESSQVDPPGVIDMMSSGRKSMKLGLKANPKTLGSEMETQVNGEDLKGRLNLEDGTTVHQPEMTPTTLAKKKGKKKNSKGGNALNVETHVELGCPEAEVTSHDTPVKIKMKKSRQEVKLDQKVENCEPVPKDLHITDTNTVLMKGTRNEAALKPQVVEADVTMTTPTKKQRKKLKKAAAQRNEVKEQFGPDVVCVAEEMPLLDGRPESVSPCVQKAKKKKRKIPVVFEFEADEIEAASINSLAAETVPKKAKVASLKGSSTPLRPLKSPKSAESSSDFISFQNKATVPTPLFCRTKGSTSTPSSVKKKKVRTSKSESKKVTFGLNKTAEFKKSDRSLLVSPEGSSRVPFDPQQKPKFGVLKSPPTPFPTKVKKTPNAKKRMPNTPKSTMKQRPTAADFF